MSKAEENYDNMHYKEPGTFRERIMCNCIKELKDENTKLNKLVKELRQTIESKKKI